MPDNLPHLRINDFFASKQYVYPKPPGGGFELVVRDRAIHANNIIQKLNVIREKFGLLNDEPLAQNLVRDDALYVEFTSEWNFALDFDKFNQDVDNPKYKLVNVRKEVSVDEEEEKQRYRIVVMMREGAVSVFLKKAAEYLTRNTIYKGQDTGNPRHRSLIDNIAEIELATVKSFWTDAPEIPFPQQDDIVWWEVWFRNAQDDISRLNRVQQNLISIGAQVGQSTLRFPEHTVKLVRASASQLSQSLILLDNLSELRKPQQLNDFVTNPSISLPDRQLWLSDLVARKQSNLNENGVVVCLLDSGVNNQHPLLQGLLPDEKLYTYKQDWGTADSIEGGGHGTPMSGLVLYGDLTEALSSPGNISIKHGLESFKIIHPEDPNDPPFYGAITEYACSTPFVDYPHNLRIFCLSVTDKHQALNGRPSTWSAAIDRIAFKEQGSEKAHLFIVSGGNVNYLMPQSAADEYPHKNFYESIHDPGQSYNAITVGTYTRMNRIDQAIFPGISSLASNGAMGPSNTTSLTWEEQWPIKPDIVMEGGNLAVDGLVIRDHVHTLKPLSIDKDFNQYILYPFGETSGAAALASKFAAELQTAYPQFWPETIRGLMIHSADWTAAMLNNKELKTTNFQEKRQLLRSFGFGVPIMKKASECANNSLTLIAENLIQPFILTDGKVKTNEYHLYEIPWPTQVLQNELGDKDVTVKLTLSYFIDPNPGERRYATNFSYHSHALDFKMISPTETRDEFIRRVSAAQENIEVPFDGHEEPWFFREKLRSKGSIKKDILICSGADLAIRNLIAIYPKNGWYRLRKALGKMNSIVRYSLIVSIESEEVEVDIYTPVSQLIENVTIVT